MRLLRTLLSLFPLLASAQQRWTAQWIAVPDSPPSDYGVYHFRRTFDLTAVPNSFPIRVSADNRYVLYINGKRVGFGPARGDLNHWRYETYDIATELHAGRNALAAIVWNAGPDAPMAQDTYRTAFLVGGAPEVETGTQWKCIQDEAYSPEAAGRKVPGYYAVGPTDHVDGSKFPWGWEQPDYDDSTWKSPVLLGRASDRDARDAPTRWMLVPRPIPFEALQPEQPLRARTEDVHVVAPHSSATVLLDQGYETTGYPAMTISGGKGATVKVGYAESLYIPGTRSKGNRNEVDGKQFIGYEDVFVSDGGAQRVYRPLWWRTWRYIQLKITTQDSPLTIESLTAEHNGYPFELKAHFDGGTQDIQSILNVGWRTARLCAHETYMDCPYYEQLQYVGDARIQALVSLYMTGDGRLMRNAIEEIDSSRTAEGATYSRAPSRLQQYIPPFSLWWIGMLHDYWMYQDDPGFVASKLNGVDAVLSFFRAHQKANGSLGPMPWWNFVDWSAPFPAGVPRAGADGSSAPLDLQLLLAYQWAADLEAALGSQTRATEYRARADELRSTIQSLYWDPTRQMYADTSDKQSFSQHAQALAVLAHVVEGKPAADLILRAISDQTIAQATIYFKFYLYSALNVSGEGDRYLGLLGEWRDQLARGLTTWAEQPEPSRSDCHGWGASPNYELFRTVLGVDSAAPGFKRVTIRPFLGTLDKVSGVIPHPHGQIAVSLVRSGDKLHISVSLPPETTGTFIWKGKQEPLHSGANRLDM